MNGYTKCPGCLSTVRVVKGLITWHKGVERFQLDKDGKYKHVRLTCIAHKTEATWAESGKGAALNAMGRNPKGFCMSCGKHVIENNIDQDCPQCCHKVRHPNEN